MSFVDFVTVVSAIVTLLGFGATLYQLRKTRNSAESAKVAANDVRGKLNDQLGIAEISSQLHFINEISDFLARKELPVALLRIRDLSFAVVRLAQSTVIDELTKEKVLEGVEDLRRIEEALGQRIYAGALPQGAWTDEKINKRLTILRNVLNQVVGKLVYK